MSSYHNGSSTSKESYLYYHSRQLSDVEYAERLSEGSVKLRCLEIVRVELYKYLLPRVNSFLS